MTYLLTEIALEMLGYEFYNLDGVPMPINLQQMPAEKGPVDKEKNLAKKLGIDYETLEPLSTDSSDKQDDDQEEVDFEEAIRLASGSLATAASPTKDRLAEELSVDEFVQRQASELAIFVAEEPDEAITAQKVLSKEVTISSPQESSKDKVDGSEVTAVETPKPTESKHDNNISCTNLAEDNEQEKDAEEPKAWKNYLKPKVDTEVKRIKKQLTKNKMHYLNSNINTAKRIIQRGGGITPGEFLRPYFNQEQMNLQAELENMEKVRQYIEKAVQEKYPKIYKKYKRFLSQGELLSEAEELDEAE